MERLRRRWWVRIVTVAAVIVIAGAVISGAFQLAILMVPQFANRISAYVTEVAGRPVEIGGVHLGWRGLSPRLDLSDIVVYGEDGAHPEISAERLRLGFSPIALLRGERVPQRIVLSGVRLAAQIDAQGRLSVRGLDTAGGAAPAQNWERHLDRFQKVLLEDCEVVLQDARLPDASWTFRLSEAVFERTLSGARAELELLLPPDIGESLNAAAQIEGDLSKRETWTGQWSAVVEELSGLPWLNAALAPGAEVGFRETELRLRGALSAGRIEEIDLLLESAAMLGRRGDTRAQLNEVVMAAHVDLGGGGSANVSRLELRGLDPAMPRTQAQAKWRRGKDGAAQLDLNADVLALTHFIPWLGLAPNEATRKGAERLQKVQGLVRGLVLRWQNDAAGSRYNLRADLENLGLPADAQSPGIGALSGEVTATEAGGEVRIAEAPLQFQYARLFAQPVHFEAASAVLAWQRQPDGWRIAAPSFAAKLLGASGDGDLELFLPDAEGLSKRLALNVRFSAEDATRLKPYVPQNWGAGLRKWLAGAIVAGKVPKGELKIEGELSDFPFEDQPGVFALDLDVANVKLAFAPDWPALDDAAGHLEFRGSALTIIGESGSISGNRVTRAEARIARFKDAQLVIDGEVAGRAERYYAFLRDSPLAQPLSGLLTRTEVEGDAAVALHLELPLKAIRETKVDGRVQLQGVQLSVQQLDEPIRDIRGTLHFDRRGADAEALSGRFFDAPVTASLTHENKTHRIAASFDFVADPEGGGLSAFIPVDLRPRLEGRSRWQAKLAFTAGQASRIQLESDLQGLALKLPEPLSKLAAESWPTAVDISTGDAFPLRVQATLADQLAVDLAFSRPADAGLQLRRALLRLGPGPVPVAVEDGVVAVGTVSELDLAGWGDVGRKLPQTQNAAAPPVRADLNVGRLRLRGEYVEGVRVALQPDLGGWRLDLSGNGARGQVRYRRPGETEGGARIEARLDRLHLQHQAVPEPPRERVPKPPIDPAALPVLDVAVESLALGELELGRLDFATTRVPGGQRIARFHTGSEKTASEKLALQLDGSWLRLNERSAASLDFDLKTSQIDDLLRGLGFAANIKAKDAHFIGELDWPAQMPGAAKGITWEQAQGHIKIDIDNGELRAVEPGAGRVLGLINFWALPRRLTLDFRDVVSKGLTFDQIKGEFKLADGSAVTDDLNIKGPSLRLEMRGRVGLAQRDYDQRIAVYPDVSSGVTIGAFLLGGPAAGALALLAQEIFEKPLDEVTNFRYRITGSWDDPQAQAVPAEGAEVPAKSPAEAPADKSGPRS